MKLKEGLVLREVCGETVIVGEGLGAIDFGKLLVLNKTAAWLWKQAREMGDFTMEALATRLCSEYDVQPEEAKADVAEMLSKWKQAAVLE